MNVNQLNIRKRLIYMNTNVIIVEKITVEAAMFELDNTLDKVCDITDYILDKFGIELSEKQFSEIFDIINR